MNAMPKPLDPDVFEDVVFDWEEFAGANPKYTSWWDRDPERAAILEAGYKNGVPLRVISKFIGVSQSACAGRANRLGLIHANAQNFKRHCGRRPNGQYIPRD